MSMIQIAQAFGQKKTPFTENWQDVLVPNKGLSKALWFYIMLIASEDASTSMD